MNNQRAQNKKAKGAGKQPLPAPKHASAPELLLAQLSDLPEHSTARPLRQANILSMQQQRGNAAVQRAIELRPPGRGEATAFERRQELVDRLNAQSSAIRYSLNGRALQYEVLDEAALSNFDHQMQAFIDQDQLVPMRLITSQGYVRGRTGFQPLVGDSFNSGYVDLDDLMASDDLSFQSILVHFLAERFHVPNYEHRIGTDMSASFPRAHEEGHEAQAIHFQDVFHDPSIYYNYEERKPNNRYHIVFRSRTHRYRIFLILPRITREVTGGTVRVRTATGDWFSGDDFRATRAAAVAQPQAAP